MNCQWPEQLVLKTIQEYHGRGLPMDRAGFGNIPLRRAAKRQFGSWHAALTAAGLAPNEDHR
jgi:hypothetical protein